MHWIKNLQRKAAQRKRASCTHPLESISVYGHIETESIDKYYDKHSIVLVCHKCNQRIPKSWNSITPEFISKIGKHDIDIENILLLGTIQRKK